MIYQGHFALGDGSRGYSVWTPFGDDKRLVWRLPRIQMMFQVYGSKEQALVTVEAVKTRGKTRFNLLALDVLNSSDPELSGGPLLVHGKDKRLHVREQLHEFIGLKHRYL